MTHTPFRSHAAATVASLALLTGSVACAQSGAPSTPAPALAPATAATAASAKPARPAKDAAAPANSAEQRAAIAKKLEVPVDAVQPSVVPGVYEVAHGAEVLYVSADGRYVLDGDLYDFDARRNLTEERRSETRRAALSSVPDDRTIIFGPKDARYTVSVFTDVDCGYCRKLHSEIGEYNKLGIRVRYLFYPRSGPGSEAWKKAEAVWCSTNRQDALTRAKKGEALAAPKNCTDTPVAKDYELGRELRIRGTPGIFTDKGDYVAGYLPPQAMLERLQSLEGGGGAD
jgi:thiol:disulfide interchange protein DsbC